MRKSVGRQKMNALLSGEKTDSIKGLNEKGDIEKDSVDLPSGLAANDAVRFSFVSLIVFSRWGVCLSWRRDSAATCIKTSTRLTAKCIILNGKNSKKIALFCEKSCVQNTNYPQRKICVKKSYPPTYG